MRPNTSREKELLERCSQLACMKIEVINCERWLERWNESAGGVGRGQCGSFNCSGTHLPPLRPPVAERQRGQNRRCCRQERWKQLGRGKQAEIEKQKGEDAVAHASERGRPPPRWRPTLRRLAGACILVDDVRDLTKWVGLCCCLGAGWHLPPGAEPRCCCPSLWERPERLRAPTPRCNLPAQSRQRNRWTQNAIYRSQSHQTANRAR